MATATAKAVLDTVEETLDEIEEQLDVLENGAQVVKGTKLVVGGMVVAAFAAGAAVTYFFVKRKLEANYEERMEREIEEARNYYALRNKSGEYASPAELAAQYDEEREADIETVQQITKSYRSDDVEVAREEVARVEAEEQDARPAEIPTQVVNIFQQAEPTGGWDQEEEERTRTEQEPYVISYAEWTANESEYNQMSLTYFSGDDTLVDENSKPINDTDDLVGDDNLLKFGHGSRDNNIVYIRNDEMQVELEVIHSAGKFTEIVLGLREELEHSARDRRPRKFRSYDE